ncbi:MAG: hypothetical protein H7318_05695 [Oligoflexus sp.]|nr:hypothetical protein [Oligoflexus sp.]
MLRSATLAALVSLSIAATACHSSDSDSVSRPSSAQGLVFTGANSQTYPWQSNVYRMNAETFEIEQLLTGESGDSVVFSTGTEVLLFNRTSDSQNYRLLTPQAQSLTLGVQTKFSEGEVGDPHDILDLGNDIVLLSHYNQGRLTLMKKSTGAKIADVEGNWDLPAGVTLKPEALWSATVGGKTFIYVLHQAGAFEGGNYTVNGTQKVFVLEQNGSAVTAVDLDAAADKVQGIKLQGSFPIAVRPETHGDKLLIVSMCSRFVSPPLDPSIGCHNAVEELDPTTQTVSVLWDLDGAGYFMNGGVVPAGSAHTFFAQVEQEEGSAYPRRVLKFDVDSKSSVKTYEYAEGSGGYYGMFFDEDRQNLFVGDINTDTVGKFTIIKADKSEVVKTLDAIPYSGTFIF